MRLTKRQEMLALLLHIGMIPTGLYVAYTAVKLFLAYDPNPGISDDHTGLMYVLILIGGILISVMGGYFAVLPLAAIPKAEVVTAAQECGCPDDCLIPGQASGAGDVCLCDPVSSCPNRRNR